MTLTDAQLAHMLAEEAGKRLLEAREKLRTMEADTWLAKDVGDAIAQQYLNEALSEHRPNDAILSEEALDDDRRLTSDRVWIIDPLDGTTNFANRYPFFCSSIGWGTFNSAGKIISTNSPETGYATTSNYVLTTDASNVPVWTNTLDGGTF